MEQKSLYPASQLLRAISKARETQSVIAGLYSSDRCPFCVAVKKEQLLPRANADLKPGMIIVEFDADIASPFTMPNGTRMTARQWGQLHKLTLFPTLIMIDDAANALTAPLVGYASRDFYAVYLEEAIKTAQAIIAKQRATAPAR